MLPLPAQQGARHASFLLLWSTDITWQCLCVAWCAYLLGFSPATGLCQQPSPDAAATGNSTSDLNELSFRLKRAITADPGLAGAWMDVELDERTSEEEPDRFVFRHRTVDAQQADQQLAKLERIARELIPSGRLRFDADSDRRLPFADLRNALQNMIRTDVRFPGCEVLGIDYRINPDDEESFELVPRFRVARDKQFDALADECRKLVNASPAWKGIAVYDGDASQKTVIPEPPTPDLNELFAKVQQAVREIPALRGAWLDVEADDQGHPDVAPTIIRFKRGFDSHRMSVQASAMQKLAADLVPSGRYRFESRDDKQLPLSDLLDAVRHEIDVDPRFAGCTISGATYVYNKDDSSFDLVLHGRIWKKKQVDLVADLCRRLMKQNSAWDSADVQLQTTDSASLVVTKESPETAAMYYSQAMHHFWKGDYSAADQLLALAAIEDPQNVVYRYWRVLGELSQGDQVSAERRLQKTIDGYGVRKNSRQHVDVMRSIYRIQGPVRLALIAAENKIMTRRTIDAGSWD